MSDDYSADVQTTGAVAVGGTATGSIETAHDQDWFAVELEAGRTYQFDLGGSPSGGGTLSDTFLRAIYDSEGRYQSGSYNDDFEGGRDSRVTFTASQSGTYYVRASGDRDETGSYTLGVSDVTPGSVEDPPPGEPPADTVAPAEADPARAAAEDLGDITELAAARFPLGTLDGGADGVAWYRFTLSEARAVGLGLRRQDADADLVLEDAEGNVLHSSERSGTANEWMRETLLAGTYYVGVEAQEAGANAYVFRYGVGDADPAEVARLEAERTSAQEQEQEQDEPPADPVVPPPAEPETVQAQDESASVSEGDTDLPTDITTPGRVVVGGSATGNIESVGDRDWFAVELEANKTYRIDLEGSLTDGGTMRNPYLRGIYDEDGDRIDGTTDDDGGGRVGGNSRVYFRPDEGATYYVSAGAYRSHVGTYTLTISEIPDDYAADSGTTGTVVVGGSATGNVEYYSDTDWFAVTLEAGQLYRFDLEGPTGDTLFDPYLRGIYDANGNRIDRTTDDDGGEGSNSRVYFTPDEGATYYVSAGAFGIYQGPYTGPYTLTVTEVSDDPDDYAADPATTGTVVVGGSATGNIYTHGDRDWFAVDLEAGRVYQFDLEGSSTDGGTLGDPYLPGIYDANGDRVARTTNNNVGEGYNSRVCFTPDEGATYYVSVAGGYGKETTGTYTLTVSDVTDDSDDYAVDPATTGTVVVGGSATGNIHTPGDRDWFAVELEANKTYRIDLEGWSTSDGSLFDPYLRGIYDEDGDRIDRTTDEDGGLGSNSRVYFTPDEDATYYVSAGAVGLYRGTYTLTVRDATDDYAADPTTTGTVVVGGSATGDIDPPGDRDWFAVELEANKTYRIDLEGSLTGDGTLTNPVLRGIYDANGELIDRTTDDDGGVGRNSRIYFTPDEDATYYVSAGDALNRIGTYTLTVSDATDDYAADPTTTGMVVVGGSATGDIDPPGDRDWFAVELEADKMYRIDLEGSPTGGGTLDDPYLRGIYDANGELIDSTTDDDGGRGNNSRVYFTPDEDATYYVSAGAFVWTVADYIEVGTYTLSVEEVDAM